jgi:hypothetical protein
MSAAFDGVWVLRNGIRVPVPEPETSEGGRPRKVTDGQVGRMVDLINWTPETLRAAHAAYVRGLRDVYTLAGHREWNRLQKQQSRASAKAGRMNTTDRAWCERAAIAGSWLQAERENRTLGVSCG